MQSIPAPSLFYATFGPQLYSTLRTYTILHWELWALRKWMIPPYAMNGETYSSSFHHFHSSLDFTQKQNIGAAVGLTINFFQEPIRADKKRCFFRQYQTMTSLHDQEDQSSFSFSLWSSIVLFFFFLSPQCLGSEYVNIDRNSSPVTRSTFPTGQILSANQNCFSSLAHPEVTGFSAVT